MYALSKLNEQHEQTWVNLQKRLMKYNFHTENYFLNLKSTSLSKTKRCPLEGYFVPSLLTTTAYILACNHVRVQALTHDQPLNIYTIFVGYPGTGTFNAHYWTLQLVDFKQYLLHAERLNFNL